MTISGWNTKYLQILREFGYDRKRDVESAQLLDSVISRTISEKKIQNIIKNKSVFVIGAGPSLSYSLRYLKKFKDIPKIVADGASKALVENKIKPDIIVTDLDGDEKTLKKLGKTNTIFVVHAHGDNIEKLPLVENFSNCFGSTQTKSIGRIKNFGGFTDGDRCVFLAEYFGAKNIILCGMDFGDSIGKYSKIKILNRKMKLKKLNYGKKLLEWLAPKAKSNLFTTSKSIKGFRKIRYSELDDIIT